LRPLQFEGLSPRRRGLTKGQIRFYRIVSFCFGLFFLLIALTVFTTQGSQIEVRAQVLSEQCHNAFDSADGQTETRCNLAVRFTTRSGQVVSTSVGDAFESEISYAGNRQVIELRYDSNDPSQPFKQSNYMSVQIFILLMILGCAAALVGIWGWLITQLRRLRGRAGSAATFRTGADP
jgi:hypothetical protein